MCVRSAVVVVVLGVVAAGCGSSSRPGPMQSLAELDGPVGTPIGSVGADPPPALPVDEPPVAVGQTVSLVGSTSLAIALTGSDPDGDSIGGWDWTAPANGSLASTAAGVVSYTPALGFAGADAFTFRVQANGLWSEPATVSISVIEPVVVTSVSPVGGPDVGGTVVTIDGTGFLGVTSVTFAGQEASGVSVVSSTQLTCVAPVGSAGNRVPIVVTRSIAVGTLTDAFLYTGWRASLALGASTGSQGEAVCAISSTGVFHLAWRDTRSDMGDIYYRRSLDGGLTWTDERCFDHATPGVMQIKPALAVSGDLVALAWIDNTTGAVWITRSTDGGATWDLEQAPGPFFAQSISLAASGQTVLLGWDDGIVWQQRSTDGGSTWGSSQFLNSGRNPSLALSGDVAVLTFRDVVNRPRRRRSADAGQIYGSTPSLSPFTASSPVPVALDGQVGVLIWEDLGNVRVQRTVDGALNWGSAQVVGAGTPARSVSAGGSSFVVGNESGGVGYLRRSDDSGTTWQTAFAVTDQLQASGLGLTLRRTGSQVAVLAVWEEAVGTVGQVRVRVGFELAP